MAGAAFLTMVTPAYFKAPLTLTLIVLGLDVALWIIVLLDMGIVGASFKPIVAYLLIACGWLGIYTVGAIMNNTVFGRKVLPLPGPIIK